MNNFINSIKSMMNSMNPQQIVMNMLGANDNPITQNLMQMAQNGDNKKLQSFAENICKEKGIDFNKEFSNFMKNFR